MKTPPYYVHTCMDVQTLGRHFTATEILICCTLHIHVINLLDYKYHIRWHGNSFIVEIVDRNTNIHIVDSTVNTRDTIP